MEKRGLKDFQDFGIKIPSGKSGEVYTTCPECSASRKNKSAKCLSVNVEKGVWICFHCGWRGTLKTGQNSKSNPTWSKIAEYIRPTLKTRAQKLDEIMYGFFRNRGIMKETVDAFGVSWEEEVYFPQLEDFKPSVCFPFFRNSELINVKYRGPQKMFRLAKDAERVFFGLDTVVVNGEAAKEVFITEGEMDALSLYEAGFKSVISVPNGAPSEKSKDFEKQLEFIENSRYKLEGHDKDIIDEVSIFYIAVDSDAPGLKLEEGLIRRLGPERCMRVKWQEGYKDANEVLIGVPAKNLPALGAKGIEDAITKAKFAPIEGIYSAKDVHSTVLDVYRKGQPPGISLCEAPIGKWEWNGMRTESGVEIYTVSLKTVTAFMGIPGMGKSLLLENILVRLALNGGDVSRFAYFNDETPPEILIPNLAKKYIGKPFRMGFNERMSEEELAVAEEWIDDHFYFILPEDGIYTIDDILDKAKVLIRRYGVNGLVIDAFNNLENTRPPGVMLHEYIGSSLTKINIFKRVYGVWVAIVVHPSKPEKGQRDKGGHWVPTPYDANGGAMWFNKMDFIMTIDHNKMDESDLFDIHMQKRKHEHLGQIGVGHLAFDKATGRFFDGKSATGVIYADTVATSREQHSFGVEEQPKQLGWYND